MINQCPVVGLSRIDSFDIVKVCIHQITRTMNRYDNEDIQNKYYETKIMLSECSIRNCSA